AAMVGALSGVTLRARRPSGTKRITLCGGLVCAIAENEVTAKAVKSAAIRITLFPLGSRWRAAWKGAGKIDTRSDHSHRFRDKCYGSMTFVLFSELYQS